MMFSASRSRRLQIVPIIQSFSQLDKNYGKEGAEIIVDNTQLTIFGGFAPNSTSAEVLSKALGSRTVLSGSVSRGKNDPSQSLQMIERPLMTPDELKSMPKGQFVVMKTGAHPMKVRLKLFFNWGITFDESNPYTVKENANRVVKYASRQSLEDAVIIKYPHLAPKAKQKLKAKDLAGGTTEQSQSQANKPQGNDKRTGSTKSSTDSPANKRKASAKNEVAQNEST